MAHIPNLNLAVAVVFENHGIIIFVDGKIVHPNVDPQPVPWREAAAEIAANVEVMLAASHVKDTKVRAQIEGVATKAIEGKVGALAQR